MADIPALDTNQRIIQLTSSINAELQANGAPSEYFEELWYQLVIAINELNASVADHEARLVAGGL